MQEFNEEEYSYNPDMPDSVKMYKDELFESTEQFEVWLGTNVMWLDSYQQIYDWDSIEKALVMMNEIQEEEDYNEI